MTPYHRLLDEHIGGRTISEVAREWGVPRHVLSEGIYEHTKSPSARYLPLIARGMGLSVETFLDRIGAAEQVA